MGHEARGVLVIDDSALDTPQAKHIALITRRRSGEYQEPVRDIDLITP